MNTKFLLEVDNLTTRGIGTFLLRDISFKVKEGECMAVFGGTGSGKSTLLKCLQQYKYYPGHIRFENDALPKVVLIQHQHQFKNKAGMSNFYYQQRFNSSESDDTVTVIQDLLSTNNDEDSAAKCLNDFQIAHLKDSPLICLSNGEHKRFQLAKALHEHADWLLLDNPFTGLDPDGRTMLELALTKILEDGTRLFMSTSEHVPAFATNVIKLDKGILTGIYKRKSFLKSIPAFRSKGEKIPAVLQAPVEPTEEIFNDAVRMNDVNIFYGQRAILKNVSWTVKRGESWCISGPNGSGKTTLLSLISGDNPQAFANDIYLFDRKRGTGETIWDIKKKIGFVSPEIHQFFDRGFTCYQVVASGLFDTIGLFRKLNEAQKAVVAECLKSFQIDQIADIPLGALSNGMQRWILLARAVIKNPPLYILDEPCQGLDEELAARFISFVERVCSSSDKTIIYVTHVESEIPDCITHFMKLENGIIKEIKENGKDHYGHTRRRHRA